MFDINVVVRAGIFFFIEYCRVVFMGKTADGKFKWRPTQPFESDWGSDTFHV